MSQKLRNFCLTINNYNDEDISMALKCPYQYLILGKEIGESGTHHLQGYCELKNQTRFNTVKEWFPKAHMEPRKGTANEAADYCKKDGEFTEYGEKKNKVKELT